MSFWEKAILRTEKHTLRQCIRLAQTHNTDFVSKHPDEARDLNLEHPNIVRTAKRIKEEIQKNNELNKRRQEKLGKQRE